MGSSAAWFIAGFLVFAAIALVFYLFFALVKPGLKYKINNPPSGSYISAGRGGHFGSARRNGRERLFSARSKSVDPVGKSA